MTTRTERGILPPGSLIALAEHRQIERARVHAVDEHPERDVLVVAALGDAVEHFERLLERVRIPVREVPGMLEREHHAVRLLPRALGEHVVQRVPVVAEPLGEREPLAERREQPLLGAHPGEVDDPAREPRALGRGVEGGRVLGANEDPGLAGVDQQLLVIHGARPRRERSLAHAPERPVVIARVIVLARRADVAAFARPGDDPPRSAIVRAGRRHRVLAVIAPAARGQLVLEVAKDRSVLPVRKRPAALDQRERLARFRRQRRGRDFRNRLPPFARRDRDRKRQETDGAEERGAREPEGAQCRLRETHDEPVARGFAGYVLGGSRSRMCSSRSCRSSTGAGACVSRSCARCVFGNAMTSRIDSAPAISAARRSRPNAIPPCGGAPYLRASSRNPNFCRASASPIASARKTCSWTSARWIRTEPPPISQPFSTTSYAFASAAPGSDSNSRSCPSLGLVNGWCIATQRFASSSYSNSGKSTIHAGRQPASAKPFS